MTKRLTIVTILALTMLVVAMPVMAGGDKNRGDIGVGEVEQHQVSWDDYASQRLVQNQEQVLNQNQVQPRVRTRWQNIQPLHMWF